MMIYAPFTYMKHISVGGFAWSILKKLDNILSRRMSI